MNTAQKTVLFSWAYSNVLKHLPVPCMDESLIEIVVSCGAVHSAASSYAAMCMVAGSRPILVIPWEWHIGLALLCGYLGALENPTTNSWANKSLPLSSLYVKRYGFHYKATLLLLRTKMTLITLCFLCLCLLCHSDMWSHLLGKSYFHLFLHCWIYIVSKKMRVVCEWA